MRRIKTQDEMDGEFIEETIKSHIEFLTEKRDMLKDFFVHCLDSKAVLGLLPEEISVLEAYENWRNALHSANLAYISAQTDFYQALQKLVEIYPNIYIDQDSYRNDWLPAYQYLEKWYKEYRTGEI